MVSNGKGKGHLNGRAGKRAVPRVATPVPKKPQATEVVESASVRFVTDRAARRGHAGQ
jgi:hypothetical protein